MQRQGAMREHRASAGNSRTVRTGTILGPPGAMTVVHIRIAEKYSAPSPVSLPIHFSAFVQSPLDSVPVYTFDLEQDVLRRADNRRRAEESERRSKEEEARLVAAAQPVAMATIMSSGILEPERPGTSQVAAQGSQQTNPASWSLRDFETQATDPFEMAELKTIDVMAELSSVFPSPQAPAMEPAATGGSPSPTLQQLSSSPVNGVPAVTMASSTTSAVTVDARQQQPQAVPRVRHPAGGVPLPGTLDPAGLVPPPTTSSSSASSGDYVTAMRTSSPPSPNIGGAASTSPAPGVVPRPRARAGVATEHPTTAATTAAPGPLAAPPSAGGGGQPLQRRTPPTPRQPSPPQTAPEAILPVVAVPVVAPRHQPPHSAPSPAGGNPDGPPPAYSAAGVPSTGTMSTSSADAFPPPYPMQPPPPGESTRVPPRVAPPPPYMLPSNADSAGGMVTASGYVHSDYSLPDVYSQLKRQEKKLVDQLKQMGFPQDRLSRAVQRLGNNQAKVLEFMFQINKFGEPPHSYPPDSAETALVNNECSEEKAMLTLKLVFELREMGFEEGLIHAALKEKNDNRDDAIEHLISHAT